MLRRYLPEIDKARVMTYRWLSAFTAATIGVSFGLGMLLALHWATVQAPLGLCR